MQSYVLHLECSKTGALYPADQIHNLSDEEMPLLVKYDLKRIKQELSKDCEFDLLDIQHPSWSTLNAKHTIAFICPGRQIY